jgi:drug/metabolite transporter (DMT)-like permease
MFLEGYMTMMAYAAIYVIWGSTYLAIRIAVGAIPPLLLMGVRCTAAGLLLLAWSAARRERATSAEWRHAAVVGALMIGVTYGALAWAEQRLASGIAALLSATSPLWLTTLQWREVGRPGVRTILGLLLGLAGVAALVGAGTVSEVNPKAAAVLIVGTLAWAAGSLYARPPRLPRSPTLGAGMPLLAGGLMLLAASIATRESARYDVRAISHASLWALAYLIVFGSVVAFSAYEWLLRVAPASRVATHAYVNPLVAVALGWGVAGEPITAVTGAAALVIAASVAMVVKGAH